MRCDLADVAGALTELRGGDSGLRVAGLDGRNQAINQGVGARRAEAGGGIPAGAGIVAGHGDEVTVRIELDGRVGAAGDVVEQAVVAGALAQVVQGLVEEAERMTGLLIGDGRDGGPLRGTGAGAAEEVGFSLPARQRSMEDGGVV